MKNGDTINTPASFHVLYAVSTSLLSVDRRDVAIYLAIYRPYRLPAWQQSTQTCFVYQPSIHLSLK